MKNTEHMLITLTADDFAVFECEREKNKMSRSSYMRFLIAEHENRLPDSLKYKSLIDAFDRFSNAAKGIILMDSMSDSEKIYLSECIEQIRSQLRAIMARS